MAYISHYYLHAAYILRSICPSHLDLKLLIVYVPSSHRAVVIITIVIQTAHRYTGATVWIMDHHLHCFASLITIMKEFTEEFYAESED